MCYQGHAEVGGPGGESGFVILESRMGVGVALDVGQSLEALEGV